MDALVCFVYVVNGRAFFLAEPGVVERGLERTTLQALASENEHSFFAVFNALFAIDKAWAILETVSFVVVVKVKQVAFVFAVASK